MWTLIRCQFFYFLFRRARFSHPCTYHLGGRQKDFFMPGNRRPCIAFKRGKTETTNDLLLLAAVLYGIKKGEICLWAANLASTDREERNQWSVRSDLSKIGASRRCCSCNFFLCSALSARWRSISSWIVWCSSQFSH